MKRTLIFAVIALLVIQATFAQGKYTDLFTANSNIFVLDFVI